jgi:DNA ligase-1
VDIYSRNSEKNTSKYPDIVERLHESFADGVTDFILDCEAVAYDVVAKTILPFQVLSTRKRKDASSESITVQVGSGWVRGPLVAISSHS